MDQTPGIIGYYAANLNSDIPTVKSANPNAFLFAFKTGRYLVPTGQTPKTFTHPSNLVHPGRDYIGHP